MMSTLDGRTSKQCAGLLLAALQSTNRHVFPWWLSQPMEVRMRA